MASNLYIPQCSTMRSEDEATLKERREALDKILSKVEQDIGQGPYYKGESISNLDIAWLPLLHRAAIIEKYSDYDFLAEYPKLKNLQHHLMESGLAEKSVPEDFENVFTHFYLSKSSYLGRESRLNYPESEVRMCG